MLQGTLPPGQRLFPKEKWPVMRASENPDFDPITWRFEVCGLVKNPMSLSWSEFQKLPQINTTADMHCVTTWSIYDMQWRGVDFYELLKMVQPTHAAISVQFEAFDNIGYTTSIRLNSEGKLFIPRQTKGEVQMRKQPLIFGGGYVPIEPELIEHDEQIILDQVILATHANGELITPDHGFPLRAVIPRLYAWKGTKWLTKITFMNTHELGFWEKYGYSDTADPEIEDRTLSADAQKKKSEIYRNLRASK
jgi:DMSO/TMAO reductase YedYZ molybdopterin-dependent catalytic subunit